MKQNIRLKVTHPRPPPHSDLAGGSTGSFGHVRPLSGFAETPGRATVDFLVFEQQPTR
jgi:hypothetical protein